MDASDAALAAQGRILGRYLVGRDPLPAHLDRYVAAVHKHFPVPPPADEAAVLAWACEHPWSVGLLDAAAGVMRPGGAVRSRILLMAAILETTPEFADAFLPRHVGPLALIGIVGLAGARAVLNALLGAALYRVVARRAV